MYHPNTTLTALKDAVYFANTFFTTTYDLTVLGVTKIKSLITGTLQLMFIGQMRL